MSNTYVGDAKIFESLTEITVAAVSGSNVPITEDGGDTVAAFMQCVYDKLVDLFGDHE